MELVCQASKELVAVCPGHSMTVVLACDKSHGHAEHDHHDWEFDLTWREGS